MNVNLLIWLGISVFAAALNSTLLHRAALKNKSEIFKFNLFGALVWIVILFIVCKGKVRINERVLMWGLIYGVVQAAFILFKTIAMGEGPVSVTTLIGNCSLLLSTAVSVICWQENVSAVQVFGVILLLASVILSTYTKDKNVFTLKWKICSVIFFVFAALVGIVFKAFSKSGASEYTGDMMFVAAVVMAVCFFVMSVCTGVFKNTEKLSYKGRGFLVFALLSGILSCVYNRLNISLSGAIDAVIFFPGFNGGVIVLSSILSVILLKERLKKRQIAGLIGGITAILIVGIF